MRTKEHFASSASSRNAAPRRVQAGEAVLTPTTVALHDPLAGIAIPFIELHLTGVQRHEPFRHHSCSADTAVGTIAGLDSRRYDFALGSALSRFEG